MFNLRNFVGKEISFCMTPWTGGRFRGILVGYDKDFFYIEQHQNIHNLYKRRKEKVVERKDRYGQTYNQKVDVKDENGEYVYEWAFNGDPGEIIEKYAINRNVIIRVCLAEEKDWFEEHQLENPYFLDKWLRRKEHKRKREEFLKQRGIKMVDFRRNMGAAAVTAAIAGLGALACYSNLLSNLVQ